MRLTTEQVIEQAMQDAEKLFAQAFDQVRQNSDIEAARLFNEACSKVGLSEFTAPKDWIHEWTKEINGGER